MLKERLRRCAKRAGSGATLSRQTGIPRRTLETYLSGVAEPKASRLYKIAQAAGVSGHWLLTGEGPESLDEASVVAEFIAIDRPALGEIDRESPFASSAASATPSRIAFHREWLRRNGWNEEELRLMEGRGDCMAPTVHDGSMLLVDVSTDDIQSEGVYVLEAEDVLVVRRIQFDVEGGVIATNDNPAYREQYLQRDRAGDLDIYGKVVWVGNPLA